jgi:hypothetical protein
MESSLNDIEKNYTDRPYFLYFDLRNFSSGLCVDKCPEPEKYCVSKEGYLFEENANDCIKNENSIYYQNFTEVAVVSNTLDLLNRCVPNYPQVLGKLHGFILFYLFYFFFPSEFSKEFGGISNIYTVAVSDLQESYVLFIITAGLTLLICFLVFCFIQCCTKIIVWSLLIAGVIIIFFIGGISLYYGIKYYKAALPADRTGSIILIGLDYIIIIIIIIIIVFASVCLFVGFIVLLIIVSLRKRISLASVIVQEACRC